MPGILLVLCLALLAAPAAAEPPLLEALTKAFGLSDAEIARVRAGEIVRGTAPASHERELVATMAFLVKGIEPERLVEESKRGLLDRADPQTLAFGFVEGEPDAGDFADLALEPDTRARVAGYRSAAPGTALNLSTAEIARFRKLGASAERAAVEGEVRESLLERLLAYQKRGLDGIAPYARRRGRERDVAADLRKATASYRLIQERLPDAFRHLSLYPRAAPPGREERFRWSQIDAHGTPTLVLTHSLYLPEGPAWVIFQRQFYVSTGYNSTQAAVGFLPVKLGTAVFYVNRTSTDQVEGVGGGARRSIGNRILASQLETLFQRLQQKAGEDG